MFELVAAIVFRVRFMRWRVLAPDEKRPSFASWTERPAKREIPPSAPNSKPLAVVRLVTRLRDRWRDVTHKTLLTLGALLAWLSLTAYFLAPFVSHAACRLRAAQAPT